MPKLDRQTVFLGSAVLGALVVAGYVVISQNNNGHASGTRANQLTLAEIPFDGKRAFGILEQICEMGPRPSGSPGMLRQQQILVSLDFCYHL